MIKFYFRLKQHKIRLKYPSRKSLLCLNISAFFLQPSIDVNYSDEDGYTGFMYVCESGNKSVVKILVDAHIKRKICLDLDKPNNNGKTALQMATGKHISSLSTILNGVENHKNYTKPVLCAQDYYDSKAGKTTRSRKKPSSNKRLSMSAIRRALKEAYLSDDEDEIDQNSSDKNGMTDLVKVVRECATDIRQIYHDQEISESKAKIQMSKVQANHHQKENGIQLYEHDQTGKKTSRKVQVDKRQVHGKHFHSKNKIDIQEPPIRIIRPLKVHDDHVSNGIHVEGLKLTTNRSDGGRKIILSDTSNYDKNFAVKPSTSPSYSDMTRRRVRGVQTSSSLPLSITGRQNKLATKLPNRKIWSSLDETEYEWEPAPWSTSGPSLQLPPLKECYQNRGKNENPVENLDRDMWKILQSYKG